MNKKEILSKDKKYVWHPFTQMKDCENMPPVPIKSAKGIKLFDHDGKFYYDTISNWWCNLHGHAQPHIVKAIRKQLDSLEHVLFAGFTHEPAVKLAEKLARIAPPGLEKIFFSDNGSTAVEVALKLSYQYWKNTGKPAKKKFVCLDRGYHGDTIGAMSVSGIGVFNRPFKDLFFDSIRIPAPYCYRCPLSKERKSCDTDCLKEAENVLKKHSQEIAAIIIEPMLLGAGGMIVYPAEYLKGIGKLAKKLNVHLIADEVATAFGRTGKMFAVEHAGISPDLMCLSKGITSGYLPLGVTMTTDRIYKAFYADYGEYKTFYHGHTFTANPLAASAAVASLEIFEKEDLLAKAKKIEKKIKTFLSKIKKTEFVGDTRNIGTVGAMELVRDKKTKRPFNPSKRIGYQIYKKGLEKNLVLRPLGDTVYFFLPLCVSDRELDDIFKRTEKIISGISAF